MKLKWSAIGFFLATFLNAQSAPVITVTGAGASFPAPIYGLWAEHYGKDHPVALNYQSIGSGGGIKQITAGTVDFGASDKPLKKNELEEKGLYQFPTVLGAVVPVVNLPGIKPGSIKLNGQVLGDIFMGTITKWDDPKIKALNANIKLPNKKITVVHRSDGSGTTFIFTNYLSKVHPEWKEKVGSDASVKWPTGLGGKGNEGVAVFVKQVEGSIGYVEYSYAVSNKLTYTQLANKEKVFVSPSKESVSAAAKYADWKDPYVILTDQPGKESWPITGATFILMHKNVKAANVKSVKAALEFFDWAYKNGAADASSLNYVSLPAELIKDIRAQWKAQIKDEKGNPILG